MKRLKIFLFILIPITTSSCSPRQIAEMLLKPQPPANTRQERNEEKLSYEEASRRLALYWAITVDDVDKVRQYLEEGYDPNKCIGESWSDKTPLNVIAKNFFDTYYRLERGEKIAIPPPDVAMLQLLIEAGANLNDRPYIWCRINRYNNRSLGYTLERDKLRRTGEVPQTDEEIEELRMEIEEEALCFFKDANRVIEAFLKAGADPDKRGHPYPYSLEAKRNGISDEEAEEYFAKGSRPINEAIKKGMWWESQVDLLLQYTTLDEDSLEAARESGDPAMVEKITRLWNEQEAERKAFDVK